MVFPLPLCVVVALVSACVPQSGPIASTAVVSEDSLLGSARIRELPAAQRAAWEHYLATSRQNRARDRAAMDAELRALGRSQPTPAPVGPGFVVTRSMNADWLRTPEAKQLADAIVSFQTPTGGWSKRIDFKRPRQPGESYASDDSWNWIGTLDNNSTTEQLNFLADVLPIHDDARYRDSFTRGIEYLLLSQFPNGCWPQVYPLVSGYHDAATYNDDAIVHALQVLRTVARGEHGVVSAALRARAATAVDRGVDCVVASQVMTDGKKLVWGAQHDPLTLVPVKARAYEHASLSGRESAAILDFLLAIEQPSPAVVSAVHAAAAWLRTNAIHGYTYVPRGVLTPKAGAGPLWARFYELRTNRPIFSDRDGIVRYDLNEIGEERRAGYLWYTDEPIATLRRYDAWAQKHPLPRND